MPLPIAARWLVALMLVPASAMAQWTGSNLLEIQNGNYPFIPPENRVDLYSKLDLVYGTQSLRLGLRLEINENSEEQFTYREVTQRFAEWSDQGLRLRIGHFNTILGRGLLHRSWELPAVVLDQPGIRSRYGFSRDLDGALVEGRAGPVEALAFGGRPNGGDASPAAEEFGFARYQGELAGTQLAVGLGRDARVGVAYTRFATAGGTRQDESGSGFLEFDPLRVAGMESVSLPLYVEYAQRNRSFGEWWKLDTQTATPHALYASANVLWGPFALSAEWKDYAQFRLGINDPPSLVKEHSVLILNRNTHVLDAEDETGFQLEGSWTLPNWGTLVVNQSRSDGDLGPFDARFDELYLEAHIAPAGAARWEATLFYDDGKDGFAFVKDRELYGISATLRATATLSTTLDLGREISTFEPNDEVKDQIVAVSVARAGWGDVFLLWDTSPGEVEDRFVSGGLSAKLSERHDARLFVGDRRGGLACTGGTCYQVPPIRGAELRLTSRF